MRKQGGERDTDRTGIERMYEFGEVLVQAVGRLVAPIMSIRIASEYLTRAMSLSVKEVGMTDEAGGIIAGRSRAQFNRDVSLEEPDEYTVLQAIIDVTMATYPRPLTPEQLLARLLERYDNLSLKRLVEILRYFVERGYLEQVGKGFQARSPFLVISEEHSKRHERAARYTPALLQGVDGFLKEAAGNEMHVIRFTGTPGEYKAFMAHLKASIETYLSAGSTVSRGDETGESELYNIMLITTKGGVDETR